MQKQPYIQSYSRSRPGFTLIELLVVIAIIAILAAILFPVFARARENARRASCQSNLKQIALGIIQYTQDYDEKYPPSWIKFSDTTPLTDTSVPAGNFTVTDGSGSPSGHYQTWMDFIFPYVKSVQVFVCPSALYGTLYPSYGYSGALGGRNASSYGGTAGVPVALASVQRPAECYMLLDYNSNYSYYAGPVDIGNYARSATSTTSIRVMPHLEGGNYAFADGHVKWVSGEKMKALPSTSTACPANPTATQIATYAYCDLNWNPFID